MLFFYIEVKARFFRQLLTASCLTAQTKTIERDWHWTSISAMFGFTFRTRVVTPDTYRAHWITVVSPSSGA